MKLLSVIKRGYFGRFFDVYFKKMRLFSIERTDSREIFYIGNRKVFRRLLPSSYIFKDIFNNSQDSNNNHELSLAESKGGIKCLFVVDKLEATGGVETRLLSFFESLSEQGYQPILLSESCAYTPILKFPHLTLDFQAPHFAEKLSSIVIRHNIKLVEFQFKGFRFAFDVDVEALKQYARVGCCVHGRVGDTPEFRALLTSFDYRTSSQISMDGLLPRIPNYRDFQENIWRFSNQKKALLISRTSKDKLPLIERFVETCRKYRIDFEIATPLPLGRHALRLADKLFIPQQAWIGKIDTVNYLRNKANEYLFVAGNGQVPLEAALLGIPTMVLPTGKNQSFTTMLSKDSVVFLDRWNFVINECPNDSCLGNVDEFFSSVQSSNLDDFCVSQELGKLRNRETIMNEYFDIVWGRK